MARFEMSILVDNHLLTRCNNKLRLYGRTYKKISHYTTLEW